MRTGRRQFDIVSCATARPRARALPRDLSRTAFIGAPFPELMGWGPAAINPEHLLAQLDYARAAKTPYEIACAARSQPARRTRAHRRRTRLPRRRQRVRDHARVHEGLRPARAGAALQPHRRAQRERRRAALSVPAAPPAGETPLAAHRRRRRVRGLRLRHHAHRFVCRCRVRRHHPAASTSCSSSCARRCVPASTGAISTRPRTAPSASSWARSASST